MWRSRGQEILNIMREKYYFIIELLYYKMYNYSSFDQGGLNGYPYIQFITGKL